MKAAQSILICLVMILSGVGQGRIIISSPDVVPIEPQIYLNSVDAKVELKSGVGNITLTQIFHNQSAVSLEGNYLYSLPPEAQVHDFSLFMDGKRIRGRILDSKEAFKVYTDIVRKMRDPALLEYATYGLLRTHIFPIAPHQDRKIDLSYTQLLKFEAGTYCFMLPVTQSGESNIENFHLVIHLETEAPIANIYSPTHEISVSREGNNRARISVEQTHLEGNKNFKLYYSLGSQEINTSVMCFRPRTDQDGYFVLFASPRFDSQYVQSIPQDVIFIIDVSGSMQGEKIEQAKGALKFCVNALKNKDRFEIISFSSSTHNFSGALDFARPEQKENAHYYIDKLEASGGTNIDDALQRATQLKKLSDKRLTSIVFLTDGLPTEGETDVATILRNVNNNNKSELRIFCFGVGYDVNTFLLDKMGKENHGSTNYIKPGENLERGVSAFFSKISKPVLTNPKLNFNMAGIYDIYPQKLPDIFKDERIAIFGRYRNAGQAKLILEGNQAGTMKKFEYSFELVNRNRENEFISNLWANRKVDHLLEQIRFNGENAELVESIKKLGLKFGIITPYTSFLVTEEKKELAYVDHQVLQGNSSITTKRLQSTRSLREEKAGEDEESIGSSAFYDALLSAPMPAAKSSGKGAVMASRIRKKIASNNKVTDMVMTIRRAAGKTFVLKKGIWSELGIEDNNISRTTIQVFSDEYFQLSRKYPEIGSILALGEQIIFNWEGKNYEIIL